MFSELAMPQELVFGGETLTISSVLIPAIAGNETKTVADYHSPYNTTDIFYTFYTFVENLKPLLAFDDNNRYTGLDDTPISIIYCANGTEQEFVITSIIVDSLGWAKVICEKPL